MNIIIKILVLLLILNENSKGERRLNPYNPFSYIFLLVLLIMEFLKAGIKEVGEILEDNPFKY